MKDDDIRAMTAWSASQQRQRTAIIHAGLAARERLETLAKHQATVVSSFAEFEAMFGPRPKGMYDNLDAYFPVSRLTRWERIRSRLRKLF
jgi:hypothetical protein